jgi:hypothetical protein
MPLMCSYISLFDRAIATDLDSPQSDPSALQKVRFPGQADVAEKHQCPLLTPTDILPWRESQDLPRIEHRREPAVGERHAATQWKRTAWEGPAPEDEAQRSQSASRTRID